MNGVFSQDERRRAEFLAKGSLLMEHELEELTDYVMQLREQYPLSNTDILSPCLKVHRSLPDSVKTRVKEYSENIRKLIYATAYFIEEHKFQSVDETVARMELSRFERKRVSNLVEAQKKITYSFQSLKITIDLFSKVNERLLFKIKAGQTSKDVIGQSGRYLRNAILVYELTHFLVTCIESFSLAGVEDLKELQAQVFKDIESSRRDDELLKSRLSSVSQALRDSISKDIANREQIRAIIKTKWDEFDDRIAALNKGVTSAAQMLPELRVIRDNAKNQMNMLQIIATIQVLEKNFEIIKGLTFMNNISLAPLTPEDACNLLGIPVIQSFS